VNNGRFFKKRCEANVFCARKGFFIVNCLLTLQSEDDGQGGRRKKKGLKQKIKEKLTGGKHKEEHGHTVDVHTTTTGPAGEQYQEQEKKSVIEKIKGKLPGHHSHH
jgi:hypothetical protein